jgi:ATP-dependent DNA helicase RecG
LSLNAAGIQRPFCTLCAAFANDFHNLGGGYIFIGIADDNGRPELPPAGIPAEQLDSMQKEILELGYKIRPQYHPVISLEMRLLI